jgi:hypothetical protein
MTGDIDPVIGGAVGSLRHISKAMGDLAGYYGVNKQPQLQLNPDLQAARDLAVIDSSLTANEIPDLKDLAVFRRFFTNEQHGITRSVKNYFSTVKRYSAFRESIARYAAFLYYREALQSGKLQHYGGARKEVVDALANEMGTDEAAAHLARNLLGDYGDLTVLGNFLRQHVIPFYSWQEVNLKRYPMMFYNAALYGARAKPNSPAQAAAYTAAAVAMPFLPYIAMQLFNHLLWPDDEDKLSDDERASPHLLFGRTADGSIRILRNTGALGDWLENFGVNTAVSRLDEINAGQMGVGDLALEMGRDVVNKWVNGMRPDLKAAWEIPSGQSIYPNVFNPRPVKRDEQLASYLGATDYYREAKGRLTQSGQRARPGVADRLIGVTDPRRDALFEITELRERFLGKLGQGTPERKTDRSSYFANMRDAASADRLSAFKEARLRYLEHGGDYEKFKRSISALDPIAQRLKDADEKTFVDEYLTPDQRQKLDVARRYAKDVQVKMWALWHEAGKGDSPEVAAQMEKQQLQEAVRRSKDVLQHRPMTLSPKEREAGLTVPEKQKRWQADRESAIQQLKDSPLGKDKIVQEVSRAIQAETPSTRVEKIMRFRQSMGWQKRLGDKVK